MLPIAKTCIGLLIRAAGCIPNGMEPDFDDVRIIGCGRIDPDPSWRMEAHSHPFHELIVVNRGRIRVTIHGEGICAAAGEMLFYRAGFVHEEASDPADPLESFFVAFEWPRVPHDLPLLSADAAGRVRELALWLDTEWPSAATGGSALCIAFFGSLLAEWARLCHAREPDIVASVREFIRRHIGEHIDVDRLAAVAKASRYHFIRTYHRIAGRTPMEDVRAERIRAAHALLMTTRLPLKDIAAHCGLSDEYHLSHLVKKYLNVTPREIRASVKR